MKGGVPDLYGSPGGMERRQRPGTLLGLLPQSAESGRNQPDWGKPPKDCPHSGAVEDITTPVGRVANDPSTGTSLANASKNCYIHLPTFPNSGGSTPLEAPQLTLTPGAYSQPPPPNPLPPPSSPPRIPCIGWGAPTRARR
ncbi:hypothetical protein BYT27DRAFT_7254372 [Phlegmacium glaucopus]|nr:hypothetical protein BYT27DRAFT_7254372 [Phlegmacium glaucopus]